MEAIKVNLIPNGIPEACHASQYDEGRQIRLDLFDGLTPYTIQAGDTFTLNVRKPDNHVITETVTGTEGNTYLIIDTTEQMTAVTGENLCEIRLENGGDNIGSLNFIMQVEKDVIANGIPSESVIEDLEALVVEAVGDNYYTKTETDELLEQKADVTDLLDLLPTDNASGAVTNFTDGADDVPVKALSVEFAATQASGTPTPSAPIPIVGVDKVNLTRTGKNLVDIADKSNITIQTTLGTVVLKAGTYALSANVKNNGSISCYLTLRKGSTTKASITINANEDTRKSTLFTLTETDTYTVVCSGSSAGYDFDVSDLQLEVGSTATTYEPYNGTTALINLGGTYYGGSVDAVTGKITLTWQLLDISNQSFSLNQQGTNTYEVATSISGKKNGITNIKSNKFTQKSYTDDGDYGIRGFTSSNVICFRFPISEVSSPSDAKTWLINNGVQLVYELATPLVVYASNTAEIPTILGVNNIFSDAGDVDVTIRADIALYIQKMLGGNVNRSLGANPSILRTGAISTDIEVREPVEPDSEPVELEREVTEQPENEGNDNEER